MSETDMIDFPTTKWAAFRRGAALKCPQCAESKLFASYLKPVKACPVCHKDWENVRADLAPAWASMTFSAHIVAVFLHILFFRTDLSDLTVMALLIAIAVFICLATLPSFKGFFMAIVWWNKMEKEQQS
jgi:uncharacterized protein (DUF983 family)